MTTTVIRFPKPKKRTRQRKARHDVDNAIVSFSDWVSRGIPRRTATGVFFITRPWSGLEGESGHLA
ncbi:MAG TPA: hypothetical protein ENK83_06990 [Aliiroseovarius sp.]|nr:hypothetical protein [Aliiroseovarius sp.]